MNETEIFDNLYFAAKDDKKPSVLLTLADDLFALGVGTMTAQFGDSFQIPVLQMGEK